MVAGDQLGWDGAPWGTAIGAWVLDWKARDEGRALD